MPPTCTCVLKMRSHATCTPVQSSPSQSSLTVRDKRQPARLEPSDIHLVLQIESACPANHTHGIAQQRVHGHAVHPMLTCSGTKHCSNERRRRPTGEPGQTANSSTRSELVRQQLPGRGLTKHPRSLGNCARALPARLLKELLLRAGLRPASGRGPGRASQACAAPRERLRSTMILSSGELRSGTAGALLCPLTAADSLGLLRRLIEWLPCRPAGAAFPAPTAACGTAGHLETARGLAIPLRYTFPVQPGREAALHGVGGP
mmetsp:Transcript_81018/g.229373  ORF Transcript_81018/g.229373 Transcript_81018/m.229373 type:complete len:261 (+) Transcript_81018:133-915(+)